nr:unnamed protein product [Digitaria exilis]
MPSSFFSRMDDVTSYAVGPDGRTILVSTADATFACDTVCNKVWEKRADWSLPFSGRAYFVHEMGVLVGIPKDANAYGHLCFCRWLLGSADGDEQHDVWFSKDNLSNKGPSESHVVGTSLVCLGESNRFCIVECVRNGDDQAVMKWLEERGWEGRDHITDEEEDEGCPLNARCCLTTFSLTSDTNGVAETACFPFVLAVGRCSVVGLDSLHTPLMCLSSVYTVSPSSKLYTYVRPRVAGVVISDGSTSSTES